MMAEEAQENGMSGTARRIPHGRIVTIVAVAAAVTLAALWFGNRVEVPAVVAAAAPFAADIPGRGRLDAAALATVGTDVPGRVEAVLVDLGDTVAVGAPLVRLAAEVAREQARGAAAAARSAEEGLRSAQAEQASAALRLAERRDDHARIAPLSGTAVPAADVSTARSAVEQAAADADRAAARLAQAEAQAAAAEADRQAAEHRLRDLTLRAPVAGIVVMRDVAPGDVAAAGAPLLRLADPATLEVVAYLDESVMPELRPGLAARVFFGADDAKGLHGAVRTIGREVDPDTREVEVHVALDALPDRWAIGQRVDVRVETERAAAAMALPSRFVAWQDAAPGVYVVRDGRARWVPVTLGRPRGDLIEVARGVQAGDTVLAPAGLRAGQRVAPAFGPALEAR